MARRRFLVVVLAALALSGCSRRLSKVVPWVWTGANRFNTLFFPQAGTRPASALRYVEAWEAEWFDVSATEPLPGAAHAEHRPLVVDLNHNGRPEIITSPLDSSPGTMLTESGVPVSGRGPDGSNWSLIRSDSSRIVADDSAGWMLLPESSRSQPDVAPMALRLNQREVTLQGELNPQKPYPSHVLECRNGADGRLLWQHEFGARPDLAAVADLDADGKEELLITTYGEEHGVVANGTRDRDSCYCVALHDDGTLLWQRGFGKHSFIGCQAGVADLNGDGKPEVFVTIYSWLNDFGGLAVLDGATGAVIVTSPGPDSSAVSHVSAGCADIDGSGRQELAVAVCGAKAEVLLYRLENSGLKLVARNALGAARDSGDISECRLHAVCDLDGDGKCELVVSRCHKRMISHDPAFYPSVYDSCGLVVLGSNLEKKQEIRLAVRCQDVTLGDIITGGNIELLVVTDRLSLYSTEAE